MNQPTRADIRPTGTAQAGSLMQVQSNPLALVVGRDVHYWSWIASPQHCRHDQQPYTAKVVFVHPDGDISVHGFDHYGAHFVESHVKLREATGDERHGSEDRPVCTWPMRQRIEHLMHASRDESTCG